MGVLGLGSRTAACGIVVALSACGGGGSASVQTVTLYVAFAYPQTPSSLRVPVRSVPAITGLQGHAPICSQASGSLPSGVALDSTSCVVSGVPTAAGTFAFVVRLTSADVQGSVDAQGSIVVVDPTPTLMKAAGLSASGPYNADLSLQYAQALAARALVAFDSAYVAQPGDAVNYAVAGGALPSGIAFDAATGMIQGTPNGYGSYAVQIAATLLRDGASYTTQPLTVTLSVSTLALRVSYPGPCLVPVGTPLICAPVIDNPSALPGVALQYSAAGLPAGFSIDPVTGVIAGTTTVAADVPVNIAIRGVYPDGSVQDAVAGATLRTAGIWPVYEPTTTDFGFASGPIVAPTPAFGYGGKLTAGVSFGADVTRVTGPVAGDVYAYALLPLDASTPLPAWVRIDPNTGHLSGVPPGGTAPASWRVQLTTLRGGTTYVYTTSWIVWFL